MKVGLICGFVPNCASWMCKGLTEHREIPDDFLKLHSFLLSRNATTLLPELWLHNQFFYDEGGEAVAQVAQRSCGCPLPGSVQGQAG